MENYQILLQATVNKLSTELLIILCNLNTMVTIKATNNSSDNANSWKSFANIAVIESPLKAEMKAQQSKR